MFLHLLFTNSLKKLAKNARTLRKRILKHKRSKTGDEENVIRTSNYISVSSSSNETPLAKIYTYILTPLTMNTQFQGYNIASTSLHPHTQEIATCMPQSSLVLNKNTKKRTTININMEAVHLSKSFDDNFSNRDPTVPMVDNVIPSRETREQTSLYEHVFLSILWRRIYLQGQARLEKPFFSKKDERD